MARCPLLAGGLFFLQGPRDAQAPSIGKLKV
jgi:hypothetical protein